MNIEVALLVMSESDIASGLKLAQLISTRGGFCFQVLVVGDQPAMLEKQIQSRLAGQSSATSAEIPVRSLPSDVDGLITHLDTLPALRVLLLPGLDQFNDFRKRIFRKAHTTVVCFEPHRGLEKEPDSLWLVGEDEGKFAQWLSEHVMAYPRLTPVTLEQLDQQQPDAAAESSSHGTAWQQQAAWVLLSTSAKSTDAASKVSKQAIEAAVGPVLLVRGESSWYQGLLERQLPALVQRYVPQMERAERQLLAEQLSKFSQLDFEFIALICASTFLASFGLLQNSAAVIIGAMLVAPLMTPILGAGLSLAHGNRPLFRGSLFTICIGFLAALTTSFSFGLLVCGLAPSLLAYAADGRVILTSEMWSRTHPTTIDFFVGLVGGSAAAFARTRTHLADALAGAAIAAALVPPIATAGLHLSLWTQGISEEGAPWGDTNLFFGPVLLFVVNMLTIMIGSSFVLWSCGIRGERGRPTRDRWATRMTVLLLTLTSLVLVWIVQHS